jgi:hypothetical protein
MPQQEQVLNKPLTGEEVRKIIIAKLESALRGDSRLVDYTAYPSFQFRLDLAIVLTGAPEPHDKIERTLEGGVGDVNADPNLPATSVVHHIEQGTMPPNEARVEAGLDVPVLTRDDRGREVEKGIRYGKPVQRREP